MARFVYGFCSVNSGDPSSPFILDPCNCTTYYKVITSAVISKERLSCDSQQLYNYQDDECQPRSHVLKQKLCNERIPWDRCYQISETNKNKIKNKCIKDKFFLPSTGGTYFVNNVHHHLLLRESQLANLELLFASMVAGSIITMILIGLLMTLCDWKSISKKLPGYQSRQFRRKSKAIPNITEGDNVSVMYENVEENEEDAMNTGYKPMSSSNVWQSTSSGRTITSTTKASGSQSSSPIVKPGRRPLVPPPSKPASLQVEMSVHNVSKAKKQHSAVANQQSVNYIHPQ
ncbi:hypothetical protein ACF0H5_014101 [Mactra antiquata]